MHDTHDAGRDPVRHTTSEVNEREVPSTGTAAAGTATGAAAGAAAGLAAGISGAWAGPFSLIFGTLVGAAVGQAGAQGLAEAGYTPEHDEHYRTLWEGRAGRVDGSTFDTARPAYQLGHLAAAHEEFAGRDYHVVEPQLREFWDRDFAARHGAWDSAGYYVRDAYGHARSIGIGLRRDTSVIGSAGSAVDPVELARAQAGLPSRSDTLEDSTPDYPADLAATTPTAADAAPGNRLGEHAETSGELASHRESPRH